ncbi:Endonuclease/exonuclease/phosphatase [Gloeopeniophorella convolvens]|nr:Endonuclease/exonuclease/phosphatase [Gloeopeniophorella convolvens]
MRILSWNLNGVRTIPQYHPWNTFKNWDDILKELQADILCFQEMKTSRAAIGRDVALPDSFHSGYSGVAVYTSTTSAVPLKAEEGLSGRLQPKPPLAPAERVSASYPAAHELDLVPDADAHTPHDLLALDTEGRALALDFGAFVLLNLYCPNEGSDARLPYKMNFHLLLATRVRALVAAGREVVVLGDLNVNAAAFWAHPARAWMRDWLAPRGPLVDVCRQFWPDREGMYTCWNTKIGARETNYGTRIDYVLVTPGLLPWVKACDIQPSVKGSDHCPVFVDLHDEITTAAGETLVLRELMHMRGDAAKREPPRLAAKYWPEFQGKQTLMSSFFVKRGSGTKAPSSARKAPSVTPPKARSALATAFDVLDSDPAPAPTPTLEEAPSATALPVPDDPSLQPDRVQTAAGLPETRKRPRAEPAPAAGPSKSKKPKPGQAKLSAFFAKPSTSKSAPKPAEIIDLCDDSEEPEDAAASWSALFTRMPPPLCTVHNEPTKEFRVNRPGPNKGRAFYVCARPVGPGWDRGPAERLREEVDARYKCKFFKWASDARREAQAQRGGKS